MKQALLIILLLLTACSPDRKPKSAEISKARTNTDCFDCYFYLFDKYVQDYDSSEVVQWKEKVIAELKSGNTLEEYSVFNRKGGGPMGAHWNSDAPLFCITNRSGLSSVEINGNPVKMRFERRNTLEYFSIKNTDWIKALRAISEEDHHKTYPRKNTLSLQENSQAGVGKILEITIKDSTNAVCSKAFHIAFGE